MKITPIGAVFGFVPPPPIFLASVVAIVIIYVALVETAKHYFYSHYDTTS